MKRINKTVDDLLSDIGDAELRAQLARLRDKLEAEPSSEPEAAKPKRGKVVQLPLWPEARRGVPNSILRGALFAAIQGKYRVAMQRQLLAAQQGIAIRFTGWQLDQADLDVWEQALHLARQPPLGSRCYFTAHGFLKALGRATGKANHEWLKDSLARLTGGVVEITHDGKTYFGPLVIGGARDEDTGRYMLEINPKLMALYSAGWTATDWQQRQQLQGKPLALWLHGFYSSHAAAYPMKVETLMNLCGSGTKEAKHYVANLKKSLTLLKSIGAIEDFEIQDGLVYIDNAPSPSQQRRLIRDRTRPR